MKFQRRASLPWRPLVDRIEKPVAGLLLTIGLVAVGATTLPAYSSEASSEAENTPALTDGVYLYGQSAEPSKIGSEYLVFEINQGQIVGGFYMPRSSFDCFYGNVEADKLALTVVDSYDRTAHAYAVALQPEGAVASVDGQTAVPMGLEGYHQLAQLSDTDQQILATCKVDHNR